MNDLTPERLAELREVATRPLWGTAELVVFRNVAVALLDAAEESATLRADNERMIVMGGEVNDKLTAYRSQRDAALAAVEQQRQRIAALEAELADRRRSDADHCQCGCDDCPNCQARTERINMAIVGRSGASKATIPPPATQE